MKGDPDFQFISFCTDHLDVMKEAVQKHQISHPVYPITGDQFPTLLVFGFPVNLIVDREGKIIHYTSGGSTKKEDAAKQIKNIEYVIKNALSK